MVVGESGSVGLGVVGGGSMADVVAEDDGAAEVGDVLRCKAHVGMQGFDGSLGHLEGAVGSCPCLVRMCKGAAALVKFC